MAPASTSSSTTTTMTETTLPAAHPPVDAASAGKKCPVTGTAYEFQPPRPGDSRSVCPAINAMANHGYIPRDGKNISPYMIYSGLRACYGLSLPLAAFLTAGGWLLLKRFFGQRIALLDLGVRHGVEHDASVVHADRAADQKDAPIEIHADLVEDFAEHVVARNASLAVSASDAVVTSDDIVAARLRRERLSPRLDALHAEIARGEMAIILGVWEQRVDGSEARGVPLAWMRRWLAEERLPDGWKPDHVQTLRDVVRRSSVVRAEMKRIRKEEADAKKTA